MSKNVYLIFILFLSIYKASTTESTLDKQDGNSTDDNEQVTPIRIHSDSQFSPPEFSEKVNEPKKPHHGHSRPHVRPAPLLPQDDYPRQQRPPVRSPIYDVNYQPGYGYEGYGPETGYYERPWNTRTRGKYYPGYPPSRAGGHYNPNYPSYNPSVGAGYPIGSGYNGGYAPGMVPGYPDYGYGSRGSPGYGGGYGYGGYSQPSGGYGILNGLLG